MTPLDHVAPGLHSEIEAERRAFFDRFAAAELFLLLEAEAEGETLRPQVFPLETGPVALAFDTEDRLAGFAGAAAYAAMSGRVLAGVLAREGLALGLNFGSDAPSETMLVLEALAWLAEQAVAPEARADLPQAFAAPNSTEVLSAIDARLAAFEGLARQAVLVDARYAAETRPLLLLIDVTPGAEAALSTAIGEALAIGGADPSALDVTFLEGEGPAADRARAVGIVIDLPEPPAPSIPSAPGQDPETPPKLR